MSKPLNSSPEIVNKKLANLVILSKILPPIINEKATGEYVVSELCTAIMSHGTCSGVRCVHCLFLSPLEDTVSLLGEITKASI